MFDNPRVTFRVTSGKCHDALIAYRARRKECQSAYWAYAESKGAVGLFQGGTENVGNARPISALIFDHVPGGGWIKAHKNLQAKLAGGQVAYRPGEKTVVGRALLAEIMALPLLPCPDRAILPAIGFPTSLHYSSETYSDMHSSLGFWELAGVGFIADTFYLSLPDINAIRRKHIDRGDTVHTPEWSPLDGMELILKEEADLDFARAKLAEQKEAA